MITSLTERIETWFDRSPKAQRAVKRLSADLDALVVRVEGVIPGNLRDAIAARIDPPGNAPTPAPDVKPGLPEGPRSEPPGTPS